MPRRRFVGHRPVSRTWDMGNTFPSPLGRRWSSLQPPWGSSEEEGGGQRGALDRPRRGFLISSHPPTLKQIFFSLLKSRGCGLVSLLQLEQAAWDTVLIGHAYRSRPVTCRFPRLVCPRICSCDGGDMGRTCRTENRPGQAKTCRFARRGRSVGAHE